MQRVTHTRDIARDGLGMDPNARHRTAERRFRELISSAGLEQPDGVDYEPDALVFRWSGPKVAVVVDLEPQPEAV